MEKSRYEAIKELAKLDDFFPLTIPSDDPRIPYDLHKLDAYCRERGIDASQLTDEELKQFEV